MIAKIKIGMGKLKKPFMPKLRPSTKGMPKIKFNTGLGGVRVKG